MKSLLIFVLITCVMIARGQEEFNISVADKTEETGLLEKGQWQVEGGFLYNNFKEGPSSEIGQLFIRHAVSEKVEVRVLMEDGRERDRYISETVQATYPLAVGAKLKLIEQHPQLPDMTLVGYLSVPFTAHNKTQSVYWSPMIFMAFQRKLDEKWSIDLNAGGQQEAFGTAWSGLLNGSVHYKAMEKLEIFGEYFSQYEGQESPSHNIGAGATYELSKQVAVYLAGGSSVRNDEPNNFFSGGLAVRFK